MLKFCSERPLRVLHVIPTLTGGGAENFLCALVPAFDERVIEAGIMSVYPTDVPLPSDMRGRVKVIEIDRRGRYDTGFFARMVAGMRQFRPHIVHAHLHNGKYWGRLAAMFARVPIVLFTEHNPCGETRMLPEIIVDRVVNRLTSGIVTFADQQRSILAQAEGLPKSKVALIENGIALPALPTPEARSESRRLLGASEDEFVVIVVARLIPRKNQRLAIEAAASLSTQWRERIRICLVGSGEDEEALRELADVRGVTDRVIFAGNRDDAIRLLYGADVFYMPSLAEGMPLALLEAMSVGLPIVSTPWTGVAELLRHGELGTILPDWNPVVSASVLEQVARSPQAFLDRALTARDFVRERHDIRRIARLHEMLYCNLALERDTLERDNEVGRKHYGKSGP